MKKNYQGDDMKNRCDYFNRNEDKDDDNNSTLEDGEKDDCVIDYEDEHSANNAVESADNSITT
eukprot:scaffold344814_cov63-Attheya_sp.AAC.1